MSVWRPWDADDDEFAARSLVKEPIPAPLRAPLLAWVRDNLHPQYGWVDESVVHAVQTALQVDFRYEPGRVGVNEFVDEIAVRGDRLLGRVVDLLLADFEPDPIRGSTPREVAHLKAHLDGTASALDITLRGGVYRLRRRVTAGVEELAQASQDSASSQAGQHLNNAWIEAYSLNPSTSLVMTEAIKAVEATAHPVVTPNAKRVRLGVITQTIKDQSGWTLAFPNRDDGHPDHKAVLVGMLETLMIAQADRHGGQPPSVLEAQGHVQLASTLVQWFSTGVVQRVSD
jgi:hypothetical protein